MKVDRGITKDSLWACLLELEMMQCVTESERDDIATRIMEMSSLELKRLRKNAPNFLATLEV